MHNQNYFDSFIFIYIFLLFFGFIFNWILYSYMDSLIGFRQKSRFEQQQISNTKNNNNNNILCEHLKSNIAENQLKQRRIQNLFT